ncbi:NAD-specific glutamate dehydrogenase, partial [Striga asiatica]
MTPPAVSRPSERGVLNLLIALTTQNSSLDSSTISNSFIGVNALAKLLAIEKVLQKLLDFRDPSRTSHENNIVDRALVHLGISQALLNWLHTLSEQVHVELLEPCTSYGGVEINALVERSPLRTFTSCPQPSQSPRVSSYVLLVLPLEFLDKVVDHPVIKILPSEMSVTSCGLHLEYSLLNGQKGDIKGATTKIENQNIFLPNACGLLVKTIGNGSCCGLVDYAHDVKACNDTSILCGLALGVVK